MLMARDFIGLGSNVTTAQHRYQRQQSLTDINRIDASHLGDLPECRSKLSHQNRLATLGAAMI